MSETPFSRATGIYRLLLSLYPPSFRRKFGHEMVSIFRELSRSERDRRGTSALFVMWIGVLQDLVATATLERVREASAMSTTTLRRITSLGCIVAGMAWMLLAIAYATIRAPGIIWPLVAILAPMVLVVGIVALYIEGIQSTAESVAAAVLIVGSVALAIWGILWLLDVQHPEHTAWVYLTFLATSLQGLGLAAYGYALRSRSEFRAWSAALIALGLVLFLPLPVLLFLTTETANFTRQTGVLIVDSGLLWLILALQAVAWMIIGWVSFTWDGASVEHRIQPVPQSDL